MSESTRAVFLSYASQDAEAARRICETLRAHGVEVWFDADGGLEHGDEWDAKIRRQIKDCVLFLPIISANTQAREEGYFRLEWDLAAERARTIASGVPFILPVVIDDTREPEALVPDRFRAVQWTRLRPAGSGGQALEIPPDVLARFLKLWSHRTGLLKHAAGVAPAAATSPDPDTGATPARPAAGRDVPVAMWLVATVAVAAIAATGYYWLKPGKAGTGTPTPTAEKHAAATASDPVAELTQPAPTLSALPDFAAAKSVAVLPFENQSSDRDNEYFSDGIADELLTTLQKIPGLQVTARPSAWTFKGTKAGAREVGEKLRVAYVVTGSVQKSGSRVRIFARLNHAATEQERWSQSFGPLELDDVFATQERIAQAIVGGVQGLLTGAAGVETNPQIQAQVRAAQLGGTRHAEAHAHYLRGRFLLAQFSVEKAQQAVAALRQAVALDEKFAAAWAAMSHAGWLIHGFGSTRQEYEEGVRIARESAAKAIAVEPRLPAGHLGRFHLQLTYDFDWRGAAESLQRARALAPGDAEVVLASAGFAFTLGRLERAVELFQQAVVLDPENPHVRWRFGLALLALDKFAGADREFRRSTELSPELPWGHGGLAFSLLLQDQPEPARAQAEKENSEWLKLPLLVMIDWKQGRKAEADAKLQVVIAKYGEVAAYQVAQAYAFQGQRDRAFEWLDRAVVQRDGGMSMIKADPLFRSLHADARWPAFLRKFGLHDEQVAELR